MSTDMVVLPTRLKKRKPRRERRWGLGLIAMSGVAFLAFQVIIAFVVLAIYLVTQPMSVTADNVDSSDLLRFVSTPAVLIPTQLSAYALWIGFMVFATYRRGLRSFRKDFWLQFKWYDLPAGIGIAVVLSAIETGFFLLLSNVPGVDLNGADNGAFLFQGKGIWLYVVAVGIGGILGPLCEELYFRGFIMQGFIRYFRKGLRNYPVTIFGNNTLVKHRTLYVRYLRFKRWLYHHKYVLAALLTGMIFGSIHYQGGFTLGALLVPVVTGLIGFVLGLIVIRTRRLGMNIFAHMAFNSISIVLTLLGVSIGS